MSDFWTVAAAVSATLVSTAVLLGLGIKYGLLPYLQAQLIRPVQETHRTVTVNGGVSETPTVLDRLSGIRTEVAELRNDVGHGRREIQWTQREVDLIWKYLQAKADS